MNTRSRMLGAMLVLLLVAVLFSCLFSMLLPASASLLAPTATRTPTVTNTPSPMPTLTPTLTPLPSNLITPYVTQYATYTVYWRRDLWENAASGEFALEDFENDRNDYGELGFPYITGNRFLLSGNSAAQIIMAGELLPSGNLLHFRDWERGLTFTFPDGVAARAFGFDYATSEDWRLTFNNVEIPIPPGRNRFLGIILGQDFPTVFTLSGPETAQGGLSVDNISYIP